MLFWNSFAFSMIQWMLAIWPLAPLPFLNPACNIWKFSVHILLKSSLENFDNYLTRMWNKCICVVVYTFSGISLLWNWHENWPFPVLWPLLSLPNLLAYWVQHFHSISFRIWNSSTGIPSPPLALFLVMLSKAHLTSHSKMSGLDHTIVVIWIIKTFFV